MVPGTAKSKNKKILLLSCHLTPALFIKKIKSNENNITKEPATNAVCREITVSLLAATIVFSKISQDPIFATNVKMGRAMVRRKIIEKNAEPTQISFLLGFNIREGQDL